MIQPDCVAFKSHIKPYSLIRLIDDHFAQITIGGIFPFISAIQAYMKQALRLDIAGTARWTNRAFDIIMDVIIHCSLLFYLFVTRTHVQIVNTRVHNRPPHV